VDASPKGVFASGATYTKDLPELTPWGQEKFKEAKDSNGGFGPIESSGSIESAPVGI
jgi:hypothetical protein